MKIKGIECRKMRQNEIIRKGDWRVPRPGSTVAPFLTNNPGLKVYETGARAMGAVYARPIKKKK